MKSLFLKWFIVFWLCIISTFICWHQGVLGEIYNKDASYISIGTLILFYLMTLWCGHTTWKLSSDKKVDYQHYLRLEEIGWFASELCLTLGMAGTIIGFIMMLDGFENINISQQQTIQSLLASLGSSMATALYTTIVGLICGAILKFQYFNFSLELSKHEPEKL